MGFLNYIFAAAIHLLLVAFDLLFLMMLLTIVYEHWKPKWLDGIIYAIKPMTKLAQECFQKIVTTVTGKTYSERNEMMLMISVLSILRFIIVGLVLQ